MAIEFSFAFTTWTITSTVVTTTTASVVTAGTTSSVSFAFDSTTFDTFNCTTFLVVLWSWASWWSILTGSFWSWACSSWWTSTVVVTSSTKNKKINLETKSYKNFSYLFVIHTCNHLHLLVLVVLVCFDYLLIFCYFVDQYQLG